MENHPSFTTLWGLFHSQIPSTPNDPNMDEGIETEGIETKVFHPSLQTSKTEEA